MPDFDLSDPAAAFVPGEGKLGQLVLETPPSDGDSSGPRLEFFLEIAFQSFEVDGETVSPLLRVDRLVVPARSWRDLENTSPEFPLAPKPGAVEAAVPLFYEQNPADVTRIQFGTSKEGRIPVRFETEIDFEIEADREELGQVALRLDLPLAIDPLRISTSLEKRCQGDPGEITRAVAEVVDLAAYGPIEKVPGGYQFSSAVLP